MEHLRTPGPASCAVNKRGREPKITQVRRRSFRKVAFYTDDFYQQSSSQHFRHPNHLGLLHGIEIEVEALEVNEKVVRERLDGASLDRVQSDRLTIACRTVSGVSGIEDKTRV